MRKKTFSYASLDNNEIQLQYSYILYSLKLDKNKFVHLLLSRRLIRLTAYVYVRRAFRRQIKVLI